VDLLVERVNEKRAYRHDPRLSGLQYALKRMQDGVRRDEEELNFQRKKVNSTDSQLEAQIRMAKIKMIEERVSRKREKVEEMTKTLNNVQRQAGNTKEKETEKEAAQQKFQAAKEKAKSEIAASIRTRVAIGMFDLGMSRGSKPHFLR